MNVSLHLKNELILTWFSTRLKMFLKNTQCRTIIVNIVNKNHVFYISKLSYNRVNFH